MPLGRERTVWEGSLTVKSSLRSTKPPFALPSLSPIALIIISPARHKSTHVTNCQMLQQLSTRQECQFRRPERIEPNASPCRRHAPRRDTYGFRLPP